jgi:hypothetical protein
MCCGSNLGSGGFIGNRFFFPVSVVAIAMATLKFEQNWVSDVVTGDISYAQKFPLHF